MTDTPDHRGDLPRTSDGETFLLGRMPRVDDQMNPMRDNPSRESADHGGATLPCGDRSPGRPHSRAWPAGWIADGGPASRLLKDGRTIARFGDTEVLVVRTRRGIFGVENRCPHLARTLADATVSGRTLTCPGHGRRYDLASGKPKGRTAAPTAPLRTFDVKVCMTRLWLSPKPT